MTVHAVPEVEPRGIVNVWAVGSQWDLLATRGGPPLGRDGLAPGVWEHQRFQRRCWVVANLLAPPVVAGHPPFAGHVVTERVFPLLLGELGK